MADGLTPREYATLNPELFPIHHTKLNIERVACTPKYLSLKTVNQK